MYLEPVYSQPIVASKSTSIISIVLILLAFSIPLSTSITNILLTIFLLLWIIEKDFNKKIACIWQDQACYASIIILASLIFGCLYSIASWRDMLMYLKKMSKLMYLPFLIFYFRDAQQRNKTLNALIIASIITAANGIIYYIININNPANPFKNTIDTALTITISTFLLLHKLDRKNNYYVNCSLIAGILINIFYLFYFCSGRTSQLIFLLLVMLFFMQKITLFTKKSILTYTATVIIIIVGFCGLFSEGLRRNWSDVVYQYNNYKLNPNDYNQTSISQRINYYKNSVNLIKEKPLLGWGTASFPLVYKNVISNNKFTGNNNLEYLYTNNAHNEYFMFGTQLGLLGITLLLWWFYILLKASCKIPSDEKYILQGTVTTIAVGCLANSWIMDFTSGHLFIILTAICLGALPHAEVSRNNSAI